MKRYLPFMIIGAVLVIAVGVGAMMYRSAQPQTTTTLATTTTPGVTATPAASATPNSSQVASAPKGIVTIEEYGDYQCPPCGSLHPVLKKLKSEFGDRVRLVFYHFPLTQIHANARDAAHAAVAARLQGKFWEMHDLLYESQKQWSELPDLHPVAINFAGLLHLDVKRFQRDMDSIQVAELVLADKERGESIGVKGTPTLFIDGRQIKDDEVAIEKLRQIISPRLTGY